MTRTKVYDTHTEIINGLFIDTENEKSSITKNDIEELLIEIADIDRISNREVTLFSSAEGMRQFNRAIQEEAYRQPIGYETRDFIRDEAEGLTMVQFEAAYPRQSDGPNFSAAPFIIGTSPQENYIIGFDPIDLPYTVAVTCNPNEETSHQLRNMSEEETIQYFDRISQEEN